MSTSTDYEALSWQAYMQSISDALAALPATEPQAASEASPDTQAASNSAPSTTLQGAGNGMSFGWREWADFALQRAKAGGFEVLQTPFAQAAYGEQCADTDGLAGLDNAVRLAQCQQDLTELRAECAKLVERCVQAEVNLARANQERDALRTELAQRMAIPARALRSGQ